jgi:hypothetical protein
MGKWHFLKFLTKNRKEIQIQLISTSSVITNINRIQLFGLSIDTTLSWTEHTSPLSSWQSKACCALRAIKPFMSIDSMKSITSYSYAHAILSYGIIFWGNSHFSNNIFNIQKRIISVIVDTIHVVNYSENLKYCHSRHNIFSNPLFVSSRMKVILQLTLTSMI